MTRAVRTRTQRNWHDGALEGCEEASRGSLARMSGAEAHNGRLCDRKTASGRGYSAGIDVVRG